MKLIRRLLKREPALARQGVLALVGALVALGVLPVDLSDTAEGLIYAGITMAVGVDIRRKVKPVAEAAE